MSFSFSPILPLEFTRELNSISVWIVTVETSSASVVFQTIKSTFPFHLNHLKRTKRIHDNLVSIIIGLTDELELELIENKLNGICDLTRIKTQNVSEYAAAVREWIDMG